ncbi:hypothetical protein MRX96_003997 [Rhipicephalus microplus]
MLVDGWSSTGNSVPTSSDNDGGDTVLMARTRDWKTRAAQRIRSDGQIVARDGNDLLRRRVGKFSARIPSNYPIRCPIFLQSHVNRGPYNPMPNSEWVCIGMLASVYSAQDVVEGGLADAPL